MFFRAIVFPAKNHLIVAPTYKLLNQATLPKFQEILTKIPSLGWTWREQDKEFRLPDGGRIFVRSADDPENLEAMTLKSVWADEAGQMKRQVWGVLNSRIAIEKGDILFTTTPYSQNWLYKEVYRRWLDGDKDYDVIQFRSIDNPYYPKDEYLRARQTFSPIEFARRFEGQFVQPEGLVYQLDEKQILSSEKLPKKFIQFFGGLDLGYKNPTAFVLCGVDEKQNIYVINEYYSSQKSIPEHFAAIKQLLKDKISTTTIYADPAAAQVIEDLRRLGLIVLPAKSRDVNAGIERIRSLLYQKKLFVSEHCSNLLDEFSTYSYEEDSDKVIKENDHGLDALRYAVTSVAIRKVETEKVVKKVSFAPWDLEDVEQVDKQSATTGYY